MSAPNTPTLPDGITGVKAGVVYEAPINSPKEAPVESPKKKEAAAAPAAPAEGDGGGGGPFVSPT